MTRQNQVRALGCYVDPLTLDDATECVLGWLAEVATARATGGALPHARYIVTPNLDHAVMLAEPGPLRDAYANAALVLADGMPLVWASKVFRRPLPERVAGSDLGPAVLTAAPAGTKVYFLGASEDSSRRAVARVRDEFSQVEVVGRMSPPFGFEHDESWSERICSDIRASEATLVIVGLGAPKQELWVHRHAERLPGTAILCLGATIDFLSGAVRRAPTWARRWGVEWVHRLLSDPKRLTKRYAKDALFLPGLILRDALHEDAPPPSDA